jgi:methionine-rich copper-binding protein CopC
VTRPALLPRLLAGFAVLLAFVLWGSGYAVAHSRLLSVTPADGAELSRPPSKVVLTFNENVLEQFVTVRVADGTGVSVTRGQPTVDGAVVTQALGPDLGFGTYRVTYKVVSADSHPISGTTDFTLVDERQPSPSDTATATGTATPTPTPTTTATASPDVGASSTEAGSPAATAAPSITESPSPAVAAGASDAEDGGGGAVPWLLGGGVLAAAGVGGALYARSRQGPADG